MPWADYSSQCSFIDDIRPLGKWMFPLAEKEMVRQNFKDVAYLSLSI